MSHPIHPAIVHFPIVFWTMATMSDLLSIWLGEKVTEISGMLLVSGTMAVVLAFFAGLMELDKIKDQSSAMFVVNKHIGFATLSCIFYMSSLFVRINGTTFMPPDIISISLSIAGFICLCITGYLGGMLVYKYGIGVKTQGVN